MKKIRIGITCIGSGVGQAVATSCHLSRLPLTVVGYGNNPLAFGLADCDEKRILPSIYDERYLEDLRVACSTDAIDILIPGLDDELLILADHVDTFRKSGTLVVVSSPQIVSLCREKTSMHAELSRVSDVFARSYTKHLLLEAVQKGLVSYPLIAKPRSGAASRGVLVVQNEAEIYKVDETHVVQEVAIPHKLDPNRGPFMSALRRNKVLQLSEFSAQVLIGKNGREIGRFLSCNTLRDGIPIEIVPLHCPDLWAAIDDLLPYFWQYKHIGPINFQGRLTDEGPRIFEMNARFTGISGLRALSGFNEVEALISDLVNFDNKNNICIQQNMRKIGHRQMADRILDFESTTTLKNAIRSSGGLVQTRPGKSILVTGGNSYLGRAVLELLLSNSDVDRVIAMVRDPERFADGSEPALPVGVEIVDTQTIYAGGFQMGSVDVICHLASGRPHHSEVELADALRFAHMLTIYAIQHQIPGFINASTQAIYGTKRATKWCESLEPAPESAFAQAKLAVELMVESIPLLSSGSKATSLRLAQLIGPSPVIDNHRIVHKFIKAALAGDTLRILGGGQQLDFLDHRDVAGLVSQLVSTPFEQWSSVLNVTSKASVSVIDVAQCVADIAVEMGLARPEISIDPNFSFPDFSMDGSKASESLGWNPRFRLEDSIRDIMNDAVAKSSANFGEVTYT